MSNVVRQTFFLAEAAARCDVESVLVEQCGETRPVTTYILQPPAEGEPVGAELWAFPPGAVSVQSEHAAVAELGGLTWGFVGGLETGAEDGPHAGICRLLGLAQRELQHSGLQFRQVVRTWYYVGDILAPASGGMRYHEANRARNEFYRDKWPDLRRTPASTGIGMKGRDVAFEGLAVGDDTDARRAVWIDNPLQTPPCDYAPSGDQKASPSFSRAAAVMLPACTVVFVSGTASIRASDVVAAGAARAQTQVTIENVGTVLSSDNLVGRHRLPRCGTLQDLQQFRVYVKRAGDLRASMLSRPHDAIPAALRSALLPVHVIGAVSAYACLTLNFVLRSYLAFRSMRQRPAAPPARADALAKRFALLGWALYGGFALVAGAIWAKLAWGRLWGWDPKETLSLTVFCAYSLYVYFEVVVRPRSRILCGVLSALAYAALLASVISGARLAGLHSSHQTP